jgi:3-oxoacyl-[acyl-carrier protein] reductase
LHALTDELFDEMIITNLRGVYATIREFSDLLKSSGDGLIINVSSQSAQRASNSCVAYSASKAGLDLMTRTLAKSLAPAVRVLGISPGYLENATSGVTRLQDNDVLAAQSPLQRLGTADDIASTIEACATTIRFATGTVFLIDGGRLL